MDEQGQIVASVVIEVADQHFAGLEAAVVASAGVRVRLEYDKVHDAGKGLSRLGLLENFEQIAVAVGGNDFFAAIAGAFMYFATLTEVPILQGLIGSGMGKGPALALLLAGPAVSLPSMLVIRTIIGTKKTIVYVSLVIVMATLSGIIYGSLF